MGMTDVFEEWKKNRFIIASPELVDDGACLVILSDFKFWSDHTDEFAEWCEPRNVNQQGMVAVFGDEATLLEFVLRWS